MFFRKPKVIKKYTPLSYLEQEKKEKAFKKFEKSFKEYELQQQYNNSINCFCDLYRIAREKPTFDNQYRVISMFFELHRLNPQCNIKEVSF